MRIVWLNEAKRELEMAPEPLRGRAESEIETAFMDAVPSTAKLVASGLLTVRLACGVEVDFERTGDGVMIVYVALPEGRFAEQDGA